MTKIFKIVPYALIIILGVALYFKWNQPTKLIVQNPLKTVAEVAKRYKDAEGKDHAAIDKKANAIKPGQLPDPMIVPGFVDTAAKMLKIAKSEIDQITRLKMEVEKKLVAANLIIDSLGVESYNFNGKFIQIRFKRENSPEFPHGYFDYKYTASPTIVDYTKKKKFLGITMSKNSFTDFSFEDPDANILNGIQRITVDRNGPRPWLKLNAGYQYNLQENAHGYGPGIGIEKGPFGIQVNQLYWPMKKNWQTTINAQFTLKNIF